jgi:hypothetical protein
MPRSDQTPSALALVLCTGCAQRVLVAIFVGYLLHFYRRRFLHYYYRLLYCRLSCCQRYLYPLYRYRKRDPCAVRQRKPLLMRSAGTMEAFCPRFGRGWVAGNDREGVAYGWL